MVSRSAQCRSDDTSGPNLDETLANAAETGGIGPLWDNLMSGTLSVEDATAALERLRLALERNARDDPVKFSEDCFSHIAAMAAYLVFRLEVQVHTCLASDGDQTGKKPSTERERAAVELLPNLLSLQKHLGEMLHLQACTAREWGYVPSARYRDQDLFEDDHEAAIAASVEELRQQFPQYASPESAASPIPSSSHSGY